MIPFLIMLINFTTALGNDGVQEFETRWDEMSLSVTNTPPNDILESLYKLRIRESGQLKAVLELYDMEIHQKVSKPDYQKLKNDGEEKYRSENFDCEFLTPDIGKSKQVQWC